jgi:hypothetical protein
MTATITATLPNGTTATKKTKVPYQYVIAAQTFTGSWFVARWSRDLASAQKAAETIWPTYTKRIIKVTA